MIAAYYFLIGWALVLGIFVGIFLARKSARRRLEGERAAARQRLEEAQQAAARVLQRAETEAREEALQVRRDAEALESQALEQVMLFEERVRKLEARNERRTADLANGAASFEQRQQQAQEQRSAGETLRAQIKRQREAYQVELEQLAGETPQDIKFQLVESLAEETRAQCADRLRNLESSESEELVRQAKRIMGIAIGRYSGHLPTERLASVVALPEGALERVSPHFELIEERTGVHLLPSDNAESLRLEGGEGTARELCRRVLARFIAESRVRDPKRLIKAIATDLDREILESGKQAFESLGLEPARAELLTLVGRLNFRTSYTQNQWRHSIEAAFLAGLMAAELGLDVQLARRATLLHDIGKALTHEVEGSHALIGADNARRCGESEIVVNAIASHHGDEPPTSLYAHLVAAADALSGARPGARREMMETYVERITDLERIATGFPGVLTVHAVQAGRELRVHVDEHRITSERAGSLAEEIAAKVSAELTFPGQIRVTVIREFKAVELAS